MRWWGSIVVVLIGSSAQRIVEDTDAHGKDTEAYIFEEPNILCKPQCLSWCKLADEGAKEVAAEGKDATDGYGEDHKVGEHGGNKDKELEELGEELEVGIFLCAF